MNTAGTAQSDASEAPAVTAAAKRDAGTARDTPLYRYLPSLDGLRGVAILWVLSLHLQGQIEPTKHPVAIRGALGVELFFAISGFLVTRSLYQCIAREGSRTGRVLREFVARRVSRIWPPYFLTLIAAFGGMLFDPTFRQHFAPIRAVAWAYPAFLANYVIPSHEPPLSLLVMWSLCFEEQFYVILMLLFLIGGKRLPWAIGATALTSVLLRTLTAVAYPEVFTKFVMQMEMHWRFDALAWGCLVWVYHERFAEFWQRTRYRRWLEGVIGLATVAVCVPMPASPIGQSVAYFLMGPIFAALVSALAFSPGYWLEKVLAWGPLALVGVVSYEIYLTHVVVFRVLDRLHLDRWLTLYYAICFALSIGVGWLFHRLFGKPTQRVVRGWISARSPAR